MAYGIFGFIVWGLFMTLTAIAFYIWGVRRGQFRNIEGPKYRMLEDREPEPWPGREPSEPREDAGELAMLRQ